jgi:hypothetical protein
MVNQANISAKLHKHIFQPNEIKQIHIVGNNISFVKSSQDYFRFSFVNNGNWLIAQQGLKYSVDAEFQEVYIHNNNSSQLETEIITSSNVDLSSSASVIVDVVRTRGGNGIETPEQLIVSSQGSTEVTNTGNAMIIQNNGNKPVWLGDSNVGTGRGIKIPGGCGYELFTGGSVFLIAEKGQTNVNILKII